MNLSQILAWLSGPSVGSGLSYLLDQWLPWKDWKPPTVLGFNPKAILITLGSIGVGFVAYLIAISVPQATIDQLDPYIKVAFPLLTMLAVPIWHVFVNKKLKTITVTANAESGTVSASASVTPAPPDPNDVG